MITWNKEYYKVFSLFLPLQNLPYFVQVCKILGPSALIQKQGKCLTNHLHFVPMAQLYRLTSGKMKNSGFEDT